MLAESIVTSIIIATMMIEGGIADIKGDSGGVTKWGLASNHNPEFGKKISSGTLSFDEAVTIYKYKYFYSRNLNTFQPKKAFYLFQMFVNPDGAVVRELQRLLNEYGFRLKEDGLLGPKTVHAVKTIDDQYFNIILKKIYDSADYIANIWKKSSYARKLNVSASSRARRYRLNSFYAINSLFEKFNADKRSQFSKITFENENKALSDYNIYAYIKDVNIKNRMEESYYV